MFYDKKNSFIIFLIFLLLSVILIFVLFLLLYPRECPDTTINCLDCSTKKVSPQSPCDEVFDASDTKMFLSDNQSDKKISKNNNVSHKDKATDYNKPEVDNETDKSKEKATDDKKPEVDNETDKSKEKATDDNKLDNEDDTFIYDELFPKIIDNDDISRELKTNNPEVDAKLSPKVDIVDEEEVSEPSSQTDMTKENGVAFSNVDVLGEGKKEVSEEQSEDEKNIVKNITFSKELFPVYVSPKAGGVTMSALSGNLPTTTTQQDVPKSEEQVETSSQAPSTITVQQDVPKSEEQVEASSQAPSTVTTQQDVPKSEEQVETSSQAPSTVTVQQDVIQYVEDFQIIHSNSAQCSYEHEVDNNNKQEIFSLIVHSKNSKNPLKVQVKRPLTIQKYFTIIDNVPSDYPRSFAKFAVFCDKNKITISKKMIGQSSVAKQDNTEEESVQNVDIEQCCHNRMQQTISYKNNGDVVSSQVVY